MYQAKTNNNKYISVREAIAITENKDGKISDDQIRKLCNKGLVEAYKDEKSGRWYVKQDSLEKYLQDHDNTPRGGYGSIKWKDGDTFTLIKGYDYPYAYNNRTGDIINFFGKRILTPYKNKTDGKYYMQVKVIKNGK